MLIGFTFVKNIDMTELFSDEYFMEMAYKEAQKAFDEGEVPVGAIVVCENRIIGKGYNLTERLHDVTAHAEMQAFTAAAESLGGKYLKDCTLYVTLELCPMCAGAAYWTQISRVVFGAKDEKRGFTKIPSPISATLRYISSILFLPQISSIHPVKYTSNPLRI
jgi:tRNA(adenine34) deaminase